MTDVNAPLGLIVFGEGHPLIRSLKPDAAMTRYVVRHHRLAFKREPSQGLTKASIPLGAIVLLAAR